MNKYYLITQISLRCKIRLLVWDYILSVRLYSINTTDFKPSKPPLDPTMLRNRDRAMGVSVVESSHGPDYPMCTVCTCTSWGPTTLEAAPPGSREICHAKVCH